MIPIHSHGLDVTLEANSSIFAIVTLFMPVDRAPILKKRSPKDSMMSFTATRAITLRRNVPANFFVIA